jgi:hypothetical protein
MRFFNQTQPFLREKQAELDVQDLLGLWQVEYQLGHLRISAFYTRVDQAFLVWGAIVALIFGTAQFLPWDWHAQAIGWSTLTLIGIICTLGLTQFWAKIENLCWVVYLWAILMLIGLVLTDYSIFQGWGHILIRLCPLWLGLCGLGYLGTSVGLKSRALSLAGVLHLMMALIIPHFSPWQFLMTGLVMGSSLIFLASCQWDMRLPIDSQHLTSEQQQFNREQHLLRQMKL